MIIPHKKTDPIPAGPGSGATCVNCEPDCSFPLPSVPRLPNDGGATLLAAALDCHASTIRKTDAIDDVIAHRGYLVAEGAAAGEGDGVEGEGEADEDVAALLATRSPILMAVCRGCCCCCAYGSSIKADDDDAKVEGDGSGIAADGIGIVAAAAADEEEEDEVDATIRAMDDSIT